MNKKLGFIGAGNMGAAIIGGVVKAGVAEASDITASDLDKGLLQKMADTHGIHITSTNIDVAQSADLLFICVKPHIYEIVIREIKDFLKPDAVVVAIAAGITLDWLTAKLAPFNKIVRVMPNTPALVNCGMTAICPGESLKDEDTQTVLKIFNSCGKAEILPERLFDAFTGVAGSAPAYVFMFIEAMADAGVKYGLPRAQAISFSAQTVLGAAQMVLQTKEHPAVLKDAVCSPGGTTIEAVCELEKQGFGNAVISAISACVEKSLKMKN